MKEQHKAVVIGPDGSIESFTPAFKRWNHQTELFAKTANLAMRDGGVSVAISQTVTEKALRVARDVIDSKFCDELPTVTVGIETIAALFQGLSVNIGGVTLIPDSAIHQASRFAMNQGGRPRVIGEQAQVDSLTPRV